MTYDVHSNLVQQDLKHDLPAAALVLPTPYFRIKYIVQIADYVKVIGVIGFLSLM